MMWTVKLLVSFIVALVLQSEVNSQSFCEDKDTIYVEYSFPLTSQQECQHVCQVSESCKFFTWNSGNCGIRTYSPNGMLNGSPLSKVGAKALNYSPIFQGKNLVGKSLRINGGNSLDCQKSCQENVDCQSWTWNAAGGSNSEVCAHNYGRTERKLPVPATSKIVSGPKNCLEDASRLIKSCQTPVKQGGYECESAFDGDLTSEVNPGYVNGWAYGGNLPTYAVFNLDATKSFNTIIFKTGVGRHDHHLTDFGIEVLSGNTFVGITGTRSNTLGATVDGSRVKITGIGQENVGVFFDQITGSAVKIHAYGSDAGNGNSVVTEIFVLSLTNANMNDDLELIIKKFNQI